MLVVDTEIKSSNLKGNGVFSRQYIKKGTVVGFLSINVNLISEEEYNKAQANGDTVIIKTGARYIGRYFLCKDKIENEEYFNHSFKPNVLYHCGICFALYDINPGEELTLNYEYILSQNDFIRFEDKHSGRVVDGINPRDVLLRSTGELIKLLNEISDIY
jgi:SET domain-containing protein